MADDEAVEPGEPEGRANRKPLLLGCLGVLVLVVGLPVACTALSMGGGSSWEPTGAEARSICEGWVRDQLKAPSTARFQDGTTSGGPTAYTVTGTVDAQNGFGGTVRTGWSCTVEYRDSDEQWHGRATLDE